MASMGPRLFSVEYAPKSPLDTISDDASMGPRLFSVEYIRSVRPAIGFRALQWGHAYSAWNTSQCVAGHLTLKCFNGATLIQRGILGLGGTQRVRHNRASMGPRLFSVEYSLRCRVNPLTGTASMGPRLFSVEYPVSLGTPQRANGLQWGHAYSAWNTIIKNRS